MKFSDLNLIPPILKAAAEAGYEEPSPIQQKAIPPVLAGRDLLGCAQTGTGKTAAFAMPILQRLAAAPAPSGGRPIRALILTPTRELALQIDESFAAYGCHMRLAHCVIFGGVNQNPQVARLKKGVDILTATPGRLNDLIGQGYIDLKNVEIFVLDEADRMQDMGFVHDVKRVLACLPGQKQTLLFSATMPREIEELADGLLHGPEKVMVAPPATTVERIEQSVYFVDKGNKRHLLAQLLQKPEVRQHQAWGGPRCAGACPRGHRGYGHPRQQKPERPAGRAGPLQGRPYPRAGGHGHCRPRHCRQRPFPCVQL